jgi:hypothetical protein
MARPLRISVSILNRKKQLSFVADPATGKYVHVNGLQEVARGQNSTHRCLKPSRSSSTGDGPAAGDGFVEVEQKKGVSHVV